MKAIILPALKMTLAALLTIWLATAIDLQYATTAGVISLLSIQSTKKESFKMALKRIVIGLIAIALASLLFWLFGFNIFIFGLFLLIFIPLAHFVKMNEGLVVACVLATHILVAENFTIIYNEIGILVIPVVIALLINLYMPNSENKLLEKEKKIDAMIGELLLAISSTLEKDIEGYKSNALVQEIDKEINETLLIAHQYHNNLLFNNSSYHLNYLYMRSTQLQHLIRIELYFERITKAYPVSFAIASFIKALSNDIGYYDKASPRLEELKKMREEMKDLDLPKSREEFENRAMLYQILNELEELLIVKIQFHRHQSHSFAK